MDVAQPSCASAHPGLKGLLCRRECRKHHVSRNSLITQRKNNIPSLPRVSNGCKDYQGGMKARCRSFIQTEEERAVKFPKYKACSICELGWSGEDDKSRIFIYSSLPTSPCEAQQQRLMQILHSLILTPNVTWRKSHQ